MIEVVSQKNARRKLLLSGIPIDLPVSVGDWAGKVIDLDGHLSSQDWSAQVLPSAQRAREAILLGACPDAVVINLDADKQASLELVRSLRRSGNAKLRQTRVFALHSGYLDLPEQAELAELQLSSVLLDQHWVNRIDRALSNLGPIISTSKSTDHFNQTNSIEPEKIQAELSEPSFDPVFAWLQSSQLNQRSSTLWVGEARQIKRATRMGTLKRQLRDQDEVLLEENGLVWIRMAEISDISAIRILMRVCSTMIRHADQKTAQIHFAGSLIESNQDIEKAQRQCLESLSTSGAVNRQTGGELKNCSSGHLRITVGQRFLCLPLELLAGLVR